MKSGITQVLLFFIALPMIIAQGSQNISLLSRVEYDVDLSDVWGYTAPDGTEYALVGLANGTSILDLSDPRNPIEVANVPGGISSWKDIKTYGEKAFVTGEYPDGLQIIDLSNLPNPIDTSQYFATGSCHNLYIEEKTGYAYLSGCANVEGVLILDIKPNTPEIVGKTNTGYSHDVYVRNDTVYSSDLFNGEFSITDVREKSNPKLLATQSTLGRFTHNTWLSNDGRYIFTTDELNDAQISAYDISDLKNIKLLDRFIPNGTLGSGLIPHNVHVKDNFLVTSFYTEGIVITDASKPDNLVQVGNYDTFIGPDGEFLGVWGAYPFFDSNIILASDIKQGLYIFQPTYQKASFFDGVVRDSITGEGISSVSFKGVFRGKTVIDEKTRFDGYFSFGSIQNGEIEVEFSKEGYRSKIAKIKLINGETTNLSLNLLPTGVSISGSQLSGCAPHEVTFNSVGAPLSTYNWVFEGGIPATSTEKSPRVIFENPGTYNVQFNTSLEGEVIELKQNNLITVKALPSANFTFQRNRNNFTFENLSENANSYHWDFGDGTTSTQKDPMHFFTPGTVGEVTLTAINTCGAQTFSLNLNPGTTSLESLNLLHNFDAYPNPFHQQTSIRYQLSTTVNNAEFTLMDSMGRIIKQFPLAKDQTHFLLDLSLNKGIYFGQIKVGSEKSRVLKLVIL